MLPFNKYSIPWASGGITVPPMMVTDQSVLFEIDVDPRHWAGGPQHVACFRAHWEDKDCFFLAQTKHLTFPMTVQKLYEHSALVLTAGGRETVKDRYFDEDGKSLVEAFEAHLDVEYVHGL